MTPINLALFFLACVLSTYPMIIARRPDREALAERMWPFAVMAGVAAAAVGAIQLLEVWPAIRLLLGGSPGLILLTMIGLEIVVGLLLAVSPLLRFAAGRWRQALAAVQAPLGTIGIALVAVALLDRV
ncbi:MAG: hypothetical protein GC201_08715 [Alphaproteobacteria bacterium]|nr:hypothetical protein [Alphaproteobacteria bacterium]